MWPCGTNRDVTVVRKMTRCGDRNKVASGREGDGGRGCATQVSTPQNHRSVCPKPPGADRACIDASVYAYRVCGGDRAAEWRFRARAKCQAATHVSELPHCLLSATPTHRLTGLSIQRRPTDSSPGSSSTCGIVKHYRRIHSHARDTQGHAAGQPERRRRAPAVQATPPAGAHYSIDSPGYLPLRPI